MQSITIYFKSADVMKHFSAWLLKEGQQQYYEDCLYESLPTIDITRTEFNRNPDIICLYASETGEKRENV